MIEYKGYRIPDTIDEIMTNMDYCMPDKPVMLPHILYIDILRMEIPVNTEIPVDQLYIKDEEQNKKTIEEYQRIVKIYIDEIEEKKLAKK